MNENDLIALLTNDEYKLEKSIGSGRNSLVFLCEKLDESKAKVAIKFIKGKMDSDREAELEVIKRNENKFMVKLLDSFVFGSGVNTRLVLTMEYYLKGDLAKQIIQKKETKLKFDDDLVLDWAEEIVEGLYYLHSHGIIHRDVKPANIFLTDDNHLRLGDVEVTEINSENNDGFISYYISPEMIASNSTTYSFNTDIWSAGCTVYELLTLEIYFIRKKLNRTESYLKELNLILELMLVEDKNIRVSSKELKERIKQMKINEVFTMTNGKFTQLSPIGSGAQGKIFLCKNVTTKAKVAIKIGLKAHVKNELDILKQVKNQFIVKFIDSFSSSTSLGIAMDYCEKGDLAKSIENKIKYDHEQIYKWLAEMIEALDYLHSNSIVHRDIKPANVFICNDDQIKLGDFGVARKVYVDPDEEGGVQILFGTDIWSTGCTFYELITFEVFYDTNHIYEYESYLYELNKLLELMLVEDQFKRSISKDLKELICKQSCLKMA